MTKTNTLNVFFSRTTTTLSLLDETFTDLLKLTHQTGTRHLLLHRGRSRGRVQGVRPPSLWDDLQLSNTTVILQKKFLSGAPPPKKNTGSAPATLTLPYIKDSSETISRILQPCNIPVAHTPTTTLRHLLANAKARDEPNNRQGAVYKIKYSDCQASYIGETCINLNTRVTEHKLQEIVMPTITLLSIIN